MHQVIEDLLLQQNSLSIKSAWLHTSYWQQSGAKLFGSTTLNKMLMRWISITQQLPPCSIRHMALQDGNSLVMLLEPRAQSTAMGPLVPLALFRIEHNHHHVKSIQCTLNSHQLRKHVANLTELTPHPEPLMVINFDQQIHGNTIHAMPQDFISLSSDRLQVVTRWWLQWQQLSFNNQPLYHPEANIYWSSYGSIDSSQLRTRLTELLLALDRPYAQLQSVAVDDNQQRMFIGWQLDFDYQGQRCRLPIKSLLTFNEQHQITEEHLIFDQQQFERQFQLALPFTDND